ncbi:hypothetical protein L6452_10034 [Arctium lappa]|uniref:Uncharacterized protein n=1 Tax=Arctium lappa TaxID=4217 RepID=A0ACB9DLJ4_ARCLA|nr:hypothetical protein L6452_10034 [Arctium lappa]
MRRETRIERERPIRVKSSLFHNLHFKHPSQLFYLFPTTFLVVGFFIFIFHLLNVYVVLVLMGLWPKFMLISFIFLSFQ